MSFRILIADDEQLERRALSRILSDLEGRDIEVLEASNGRQAVEAAAAGPIDLAFLDIRMPGMDGLQAAHAIRELSPQTRIVFVTAFDQFDYAREALRLGVDEYLVKPAAAEEVRAMALGILEKIEKARASGALGPRNDADRKEALALLEEELRLDLGRDDLDAGRLESFLDLKGLEGRPTAALVLRMAGTLPQETETRRLDAHRLQDATERKLRHDGWYTLAAYDDMELRCIAVSPFTAESPEDVRAATLKGALETLASDLLTSLGIRMLAGACLWTDGPRPFRSAREAACLARIERPVVVLTQAETEHGPGDTGGEGSGYAAVERAVSFMQAHLAQDLSLADVAGAVGTAPTHLSRLFRRHRGDTFVQAFCRLRMDAAKRLLRTGQYRVKEICCLVGFRDTAYFCRVFRKYEGSSPAAFQKNTPIRKNFTIQKAENRTILNKSQGKSKIRRKE